MSPGFVLVTGATGFVGRQLCPVLVRAGWRVRAVWVHSAPPSGMRDAGIEWCRAEPMGPDTNWASLLDGGITAVVHLAAVAHRIATKDQVSDSVYDEVNHLGTVRLISQVAAIPTIQRFLFISSIGAVASLSELRLDESSPCRPDTPYGKSKLAAERAVSRLLASSSVEWCILRPPLIYGRGNPGNMERLLRLIALPVPLPFGSIRNRRTFLHVGNLVDAIRIGLIHPKAANRLFCVADAEELSTPDLMRGLGQAAGRPVRLFRFPVGVLQFLGWMGSMFTRITGKSLGFGSPTIEKFCGSLSIDSSSFRSECGWCPPVSLQEGLRSTVGREISP